MKPLFLTKLVLEKSANNDDPEWTVAEPLHYRSKVLNRVVVVSKGFKTDLASVPRLPLVYMLTADFAKSASVVHDYLYSTREVPRILADAVFKEASEVCKVPAWQRGLMWLGVRVFGGSHWKN